MAAERGLHIGDQLVIEPFELVAGGDSIAKVDGYPIFTAGLYPGDRAEVRIIEARKGFARAETVKVERASNLRRTEPCPIAGECGGCDWTELRLDAQLQAKERIVRESLRRTGKLAPDAIPPITIHPSPLNYRLRSRLHRDGDVAGFYAARSNRIVPLARECEVVGSLTARTFGIEGTAKKTIAGEQPLSFASARVDSDDGLAPAEESHAEDAVWELDGMLVLEGAGDFTLRVGDFTYQLSTDAFFQVNRHLLPLMLRLVAEHAGRTRGERAIDLYSGVGFFTMPLSKRFQSVIAVEGSPVAHRHALRNAARNTTVVHGAVESYVSRMPKADLIFLDPPRAGARPAVIDAIAHQAQEMVCYLSCDPVTFARDANRLIASGWRLATLDLLDLFPNTHHVETLSSFERAG